MALNTQGSALNALLTPDRIAMETLFQVRNRLLFPMLGSHALERYFVSQEGARVSIKRPFRATASSGRKLSDAQINAMIDEVATLTIDQRHKFAVNYSDDDMRLHIKDFQMRYLDEGCKELAYMQDIACAREVTKMTAQSDGTPSTALTTTIMSSFRAHCVEIGIDPYECSLVARPRDVSALGDDVKLVNVPKMVNQAIRNKYMGKIDGFPLYESIHVPLQKIAASSTGLTIDAASSLVGNSITITGLTVSTANILLKGTLFTIAGVNEIQPRGEREDTGRLKTFTVLMDASSDANGDAVVSISPSISDGTSTVVAGDGTTSLTASAYKTVSAKPAAGDVVKLVGSDGTAVKTFNQVIAFEKRGLQVANVALKRLKGFSDFTQATDPETGLTITISCDADIKDMEEIRRCDVLYGVLNPYPEVCMRAYTDEL